MEESSQCRKVRNLLWREFQNSTLLRNATPLAFGGSIARSMALVSDDWRRCADVFGGRLSGILPRQSCRESIACAVAMDILNCVINTRIYAAKLGGSLQLGGTRWYAEFGWLIQSDSFVVVGDGFCRHGWAILVQGPKYPHTQGSLAQIYKMYFKISVTPPLWWLFVGVGRDLFRK